MKRLLIITLIGLVIWQVYLKNNSVIEEKTSQVVSELTNNAEMQNFEKEIPNFKVTYRCDGGQYCSQMGSYEEAKYFLNNCPNTKMDGDRDGIPCEKQFNKW
ncbi:MAG: excalibur calcium-binding domain-containing protein [Vibrio hibernica]